MKKHTPKIYTLHTCDGAEQSQCGRIARILIDHALAVRLRCRHTQRDGLVEFTATRLNGNDGRNGNSAAQQFCGEIRIDRLGLRFGLGSVGFGCWLIISKRKNVVRNHSPSDINIKHQQSSVINVIVGHLSFCSFGFCFKY